MQGLMVVDVQYDFLAEGSLPILDAEEILPIIQDLAKKFKKSKCFATQDYHPANHSSFVENGGVWPVHCVGGTKGAMIHEDLDGLFGMTLQKGHDRLADSYSVFYDENGRKSEATSTLREAGVDELFICGLATDYCVKSTVLDALKDGFIVYVITDACKGVDLSENDVQRALSAMKQAGATLITSDHVVDYVV